jgi:hypothetical protein
MSDTHLTPSPAKGVPADPTPPPLDWEPRPLFFRCLAALLVRVVEADRQAAGGAPDGPTQENVKGEPQPPT